MMQQAWCFDSVSRVCTCSAPPLVAVPELPPLVQDCSAAESLSAKSYDTVIYVLVALVVVAGLLIGLLCVYRRRRRENTFLLDNTSVWYDSGPSRGNTLPMQKTGLPPNN